MAGWSGLAKLDLSPIVGLLPEKIRTKAKAVAATIGSAGVTATTLTALLHAPSWVPVVIAIVTGLAAPIATYQTPKTVPASTEV